MKPAPRFGPEDFAAALSVSHETLARFEVWRSLLATWNPAINLVAKATLPDFWRRHALDAAQLLDLAPPEARRWVDLGSGAGLPGLAVALLGPGRGIDIQVTLIECDARKAAFLREAVRLTGAPARVRLGRAEGAGDVAADVVTARALAPLPALLALAEPWLARGATGLFLKGRGVGREITALGPEGGRAWSIETMASRSDAEGCILRVRARARAA